MITLLETVIERSDGAYVDTEDLEVLDRAFESWGDRRNTYGLIQDKEAIIVEKTLERFQQENANLLLTAPDSVFKKCQSDLTSVLRNCAMAMLLQDETLLKDRFLYWMQNIMRALKNQRFNVHIYQILQDVVSAELPEHNANLIMPYLRIAHQYLSK
jgi:Phycobilisome protein